MQPELFPTAPAPTKRKNTANPLVTQAQEICKAWWEAQPIPPFTKRAWMQAQATVKRALEAGHNPERVRLAALAAGPVLTPNILMITLEQVPEHLDPRAAQTVQETLHSWPADRPKPDTSSKRLLAALKVTTDLLDAGFTPDQIIYALTTAYAWTPNAVRVAINRQPSRVAVPDDALADFGAL